VRSLAALLLFTLGCSGSTTPSPAPAADPVPLPALEHVDPDVIAAIQEARAEVARELASAKAWGRLADRYFVHDFMDEAALCYARAEELDAESYLWPYRLGWSLMDDRPEEAVAPFERALGRLARYAQAYEAMGEVLVRVGRGAEAVPHFEKASELDPKSGLADTSLGLYLVAQGEFERARTHLERALAREEKRVETHVGLAQVYLALGEAELARKHSEFSRTLPQSSRREDPFASPNVTPAGARARAKFARQLERQGKLAEAEEQYRAALGANPEHYQARIGLAELLARGERRPEALALLREGIALMPGFTQAEVDLARLESGAAAVESSEE
jgi:tetratricopeptide (TPR) repeat protein